MAAIPMFYVGTEVQRAASTAVPAARGIVVTDEGNIYLGDGSTQAKALLPRANAKDLIGLLKLLPSAHGIVGDYTGRIGGGGGTGTDDRQGIQSWLNDHSDVTGSGHYAYQTRRSYRAALRPSNYLLSAPSDGSPSLKVPAGVDFDFGDAAIAADLPSTATSTWSAIQAGQYSNVHVGKLYNSGRVAAPDTARVYDGIRLWQTDNNTRVAGGRDSEISGFQGAGVRGVGAWITFISDIRFNGIRGYGYIASNYGDGTLGGTVDNPSGGGTNRAHTDLRLDGCHFVNLTDGGILSPVQGAAGSINTLDFVTSGFTLGAAGCIFESIGGIAIDLGPTFGVSLHDCAFEEVGAAGHGMIRVNGPVRNLAITGTTRVNLAGRAVSGPSGTVTPDPSYFVEAVGLTYLHVDTIYLKYSLDTIMQLVSAAPSGGWSIGGVVADSNDFAAGPCYGGKFTTSRSGVWNKGHDLIGGAHVWADTAGHLRTKGSSAAPTSATDGGYVNSDRAMKHRVRSGAYTFPLGPVASAVTLANGTCRYMPTDIGDAVAFSKIGLEITAAGNTGAQVVLGVYAEDQNGLPTGTALVSGTIAASATGWVEATISWTPPKAGRYIVAATAINAATTAPQIRSATGFMPGVVCFTTPPTNLAGYVDSATGLVALPAAPAVVSNVGGPMVALKAA